MNLLAISRCRRTVKADGLERIDTEVSETDLPCGARVNTPVVGLNRARDRQGKAMIEAMVKVLGLVGIGETMRMTRVHPKESENRILLEDTRTDQQKAGGIEVAAGVRRATIVVKEAEIRNVSTRTRARVLGTSRTEDETRISVATINRP